MENDEMDILKQAAAIFERQDRLKRETRETDETIRVLCRAFDRASGCSGMPPYKLRLACETRGLI